MRHKHADLIHAWAEGAEIEVLVGGDWRPCHQIQLSFDEYSTYRIKPEKKPDVETYHLVDKYQKDRLMPKIIGSVLGQNFIRNDEPANLKLTFDGETGKLKSAEVLNANT